MGERALILAGGLGTRLLPMTRITNKHLLPVFERPMIEGIISCFLESGIGPEIRIVTGGPQFDQILRVYGDGSDFPVPPGCPHPRLTYSFQKGEGGIGAAMLCGIDHFGQGSPVIVGLGDNGADKRDVERGLRQFRLRGSTGCHLFLTETPYPRELGVARFARDGRLIEVVEKPKGRLPSRKSVSGIYFYDSKVWKRLKKLKASARGEIEVTDLNNLYIERGEATYTIMEYPWVDAGSPYGRELASMRRMKALDPKLYRQLLRELGEGDIKKSKKRR
jgi:glucose-1-phosphate thymidylyltransferase